MVLDVEVGADDGVSILVVVVAGLDNLSVLFIKADHNVGLEVSLIFEIVLKLNKVLMGLLLHGKELSVVGFNVWDSFQEGIVIGLSSIDFLLKVSVGFVHCVDIAFNSFSVLVDLSLDSFVVGCGA